MRRRQERAFERLYRRHVGDVYRYALLVLGDEEHAESVTQATFVRAYQAYKNGERPAKAHTWLLGIAHRVCGRRSRGIDAALPEELLDDEPGPTPADIRRALDALGFEERAALMMREVEGRSCAEIANFLELSQAEAETLVFRSRRALRAELEASLTCYQAERAISRRLDGRLDRSDRRRLRAHLHACPDCAALAALDHGHRAALRSFQLVPVPESLRLSARGSARAGVLARTAALGAIALVVGGLIAGGMDPRQWGPDATRIEPAGAAPPRVAKKKVTPAATAKPARERAARRRRG